MKYKVLRATTQIVYEYTEVEAENKEEAQTISEESLTVDWHENFTDVKECTYDIEEVPEEESCTCSCGNQHMTPKD